MEAERAISTPMFLSNLTVCRKRTAATVSARALHF
jgi:hypothetical protein